MRRAMALKFQLASESPGGLQKTQIPGPHPRVFDSVGPDEAEELHF